ncbi:MAG: hypothetical protein HQK71_04850 [Desulfamplus sp.]|nr:hypothetical protein [Desulfamplus sp.]
MVDNTNDPLGVESIMKTWSNSMNELMGSQEFYQNISKMMMFPFSESPFQSPFDPSFQEFLQQPFKTISEQSNKEKFYWPFGTKFESGGDKESVEQRKDAMAAMAKAMKNWHIMANAMSSPESMSALFKGIGALPEMLANVTQSTMSGMAEINQRMIDSLSRMGQSVKAYKFDNIDENVFQAWSDIYEKEFRKFLHIPQLGLTREYQEKINDMADKLNISQTNIAEFLRMLSLPFQRSAVVMQDEIQKIAEKGELSDDPQFYYQMWLKILEGHFMTLFQTPEYIDTLTKTLASMSQFTKAKEMVLEDALKKLPLASRSEVDDIAKELHQLKRELRILKKKMSTSGGAI